MEGLNLVTFSCLNNVEPFPVITPAHEFMLLSLDILNEEIDRKNRMPVNPGSLLIIGWNIHFFPAILTDVDSISIFILHP